MTVGQKAGLGLATAGWVSLGIALASDLGSGTWEGCNELPQSSGETATLLGLVAAVIAFFLAGLFAIGGGLDTRRGRVLTASGGAVSFAALVGVYLLSRHHAVGPGCG